MPDPYSVIVLYRTGNADSQEFASYYAAAHNLTASTLSVPCSGNEILTSYSLFQTEIENTVAAYIALHPEVDVIVVGYGVPGGFQHNNRIISTTSRLISVTHTLSPDLLNPLYSRKSSHRMSSNDLLSRKITGRIDAPTLADAKRHVDRAVAVMHSNKANGTLFLDPFPLQSHANGTIYRNDLQDFITNTLPDTGLSYFVTTNVADTDVVLPHAQNDSFVWSCGAASSSDSFFKLSASNRVFLYNADTNGALTLRDAASTHWPSLAMRNGYAGTAGSLFFLIGDESHYLRPRPMFDALMAGANLGEAYLFGIPYLDSADTILGDPLVTTSFPSGVAQVLTIPETVTVDLLIDRVSSAAAALYQKKIASEDALDIATEWSPAGLPAAMEALRGSLETSYVDDMARLGKAILSLTIPSATNNPTTTSTNTFLEDNDVLANQLFADIVAPAGVIIDPTLLLEEGTWQVDHTINDNVTSQFVYYHFNFSIATDAAFQNILFSVDSWADQTGWFYQKEPSAFSSVPSQGVPSSHVGRKVRYRVDIESFPGQILARGTIYHIRFYQRHGGEQFTAVNGTIGVYS